MAQNLSRFLSLNILLGLCGLAATQQIYIEYLLTGCLVLGGGCRGAQIVGGSAGGSQLLEAPQPWHHLQTS